MLFIKLLSGSKCKPNKISVDKSNEFYNRSTKIIEIYLKNHLGKSVCIKRFIRTLNLKTKIYKYMASISKIMYIEKLDDIVNKYNNTYPAAIKIKAVGVKKVCKLFLVKKVMIKILNLKLMIMSEY